MGSNLMHFPDCVEHSLCLGREYFPILREHQFLVLTLEKHHSEFSFCGLYRMGNVLSACIALTRGLCETVSLHRGKDKL